MKTLYIIRHAKSSWDFPSLSDHDRPLNKRGQRDAPAMGLRLKIKEIVPDLIISSTAKRAQTTAREIAQQIGYPEQHIILTRRLYHADIGEIVDLLAEEKPENRSIMIFGHNPGFTDFANWLTGEYIDNIPTAGVVSVNLAIESWADIKKGIGQMQFFDYPKKPQE